MRRSSKEEKPKSVFNHCTSCNRTFGSKRRKLQHALLVHDKREEIDDGFNYCWGCEESWNSDSERAYHQKTCSVASCKEKGCDFVAPWGLLLRHRTLEHCKHRDPCHCVVKAFYWAAMLELDSPF